MGADKRKKGEEAPDLIFTSALIRFAFPSNFIFLHTRSFQLPSVAFPSLSSFYILLILLSRTAPTCQKFGQFVLTNSANIKMTTPGAGHEFPPVDVSWTKRDVLLFAASIGCTVDELHFLYVRLTLLSPPKTLSPSTSTLIPPQRTTRNSTRTSSPSQPIPSSSPSSRPPQTSSTFTLAPVPPRPPPSQASPSWTPPASSTASGI